MNTFDYIYGIFSAICLIVGIGYILITGGERPSNDPNKWEASKPYNHYQKQQQRELQLQQIKYQQQRTISTQQMNIPTQYNNSYSGTSSRNNYSDLWDECETIIAALDDADVDHDDLYYPMDYYDLRDFRDELEALAEEYDVDW